MGTINVDWANLSPKQYLPLNGHIEARFRASTGQWTAPTLVAGTEISVSGLSPGLNYGQQCYEGLKAFRTIDGRINVFRPQFHASRIRRSAGSVCLPPPPEDLFLECIRRAVAENAEYVPPSESDAFLYIRPVLFGASTGLWGPCDEIILAVFVHPAKPQHGADAVAGVVCDEFDRCAPRGTGSFKVGGNYAPVGYPQTVCFSLPSSLTILERSGGMWQRPHRWDMVLCCTLTARRIRSLKNSRQVASLVTGSGKMASTSLSSLQLKMPFRAPRAIVW